MPMSEQERQELLQYLMQKQQGEQPTEPAAAGLAPETISQRGAALKEQLAAPPSQGGAQDALLRRAAQKEDALSQMRAQRGLGAPAPQAIPESAPMASELTTAPSALLPAPEESEDELARRARMGALKGMAFREEGV